MNYTQCNVILKNRHTYIHTHFLVMCQLIDNVEIKS